jgi:hypothetical protein
VREGEERVADGSMWTASSQCTVAADSVVTAKPTAGKPMAVGMGAHHAKAEQCKRCEENGNAGGAMQEMRDEGWGCEEEWQGTEHSAKTKSLKKL